MQFYNKIMLYFWLAFSIVAFVTVTYKVITIGFDIWASYYVFPALALAMYFFKKYMVKRMNKHQEYLDNKNKS